jgi:hypothetical protein
MDGKKFYETTSSKGEMCHSYDFQYTEYDNIAFVDIDFQNLSQYEINLMDGHVAERQVHGI